MACLRSVEEFSIQLFPVIDGLYACSFYQEQMLNFINRVFSMLAVNFIREKNQSYRFKVRCGMAYGPVVEGNRLLRCAPELQRNPAHTKSVLLGAALIHAYQIEKEAPPFGIAVHESATWIAGGIPLSGPYLEWWKYYSREKDALLACELYQSLKEHYVWCSSRSANLGYDRESMEKHKVKVDEYFAGCIRSQITRSRYFPRY
jgi:hypothetical protein